MSQFQYTVSVGSTGDIEVIQRAGAGPNTAWDDPDFQSWNAALPIPYVLSPLQQVLQTARTQTRTQFQTWWAGLTVSQQADVLFLLLRMGNRDGVI